MEKETSSRRVSILGRIGWLFSLIGTGGMAIYGRTPLGLFAVLGGAILILESFRGKKSDLG